ncbi:hypothetical protein IWZ00DRAFT_518226 [Phyllosticta capitalensis]|uniref:Uncharacterized protein n=1 Tax=Phyllosticta capitalensis TaxID=121624 RepID=A0ABR1YBZ8_9PEZI
MASTRLRKAFRYPTDSDSDSDGGPVEGIDEEEQAQLIARLRAQDAARTTFYRRAFVSLPALSALLYLRPLLAPANFSECLTALLALTSLAASGWILCCVPLSSAPSATSAFEMSDGARRGAGNNQTPLAHWAQALGLLPDGEGPLERYMGVLNVLVAGIVALSCWAAGERVGEWEGWVPGIVLGLVFLVRSQLAPVDVAGLEKLRYGYKGA